MSFVDKVEVSVKAGNGGDGKLSFRHEKFIAKGGPDGGDGGDGGNVILEASRNQNTLAAFRYRKELKADSGQGGERRRMHGKNGADLIVKVPVGTVASTKNKVVADLVSDGQSALIASGGKGGYGNAHFVSSRRQAPGFAEKGEPGESFNLNLELKMIADVGLVGLPNVGKSTLLARLSHARPEIADYPFTTLAPNLGVVDIDNETAILLADIPGLIKGAAEGKGLGHDFLRHIERTAVILHLIDAYTENVAEAYTTIRQELKTYEVKLAKKMEVVALNKIDGLDQEIIDDLINQLKTVVPKKTLLYPISAQSGQGLNELVYSLAKLVKKSRAKPADRAKTPLIPILTLPDVADSWQVNVIGHGWLVTGRSIERFASRTDFTNDEALKRLKNIMRRNGITQELLRQGLVPGQSIQIGADSNHNFVY